MPKDFSQDGWVNPNKYKHNASNQFAERSAYAKGGSVKTREYHMDGDEVTGVKRKLDNISSNSSSSEDEMQNLMGFGGFSSTKNKQVKGQSSGGSNISKAPRIRTSPPSSDSDIFDDEFVSHMAPRGMSPNSKNAHALNEFNRKGNPVHSTLEFANPSAFKKHLKSTGTQALANTGDVFETRQPFDVTIREVSGNVPAIKTLAEKPRNLLIAGNPQHLDQKGRTKIRHYHGIDPSQR